MSKQLVIIIFAVISIAATLVVGMLFTRKQRSLGTYFIAEKTVPPLILGIAAAAGLVSGSAFIGSPGMAYKSGIGYLTAWSIVPFSAFIPWFFLARKFRLLADTHNCMTVPDVISARFNSTTLTLLCSLSALFGLIAYTATQLMALGYLFGVVFGLPFEAAVFISVATVGMYAALGGQKGVIWTNVLQGVLMIAASLGGFASAIARDSAVPLAI